MTAALYADTGVLELLLKAGANVNATNQAGVTALMAGGRNPAGIRAVTPRQDIGARH